MNKSLERQFPALYAGRHESTITNRQLHARYAGRALSPRLATNWGCVPCVPIVIESTAIDSYVSSYVSRHNAHETTRRTASDKRNWWADYMRVLSFRVHPVLKAKWVLGEHELAPGSHAYGVAERCEEESCNGERDVHCCWAGRSFLNEKGTSQETTHNTVRRAELVNPICATQHSSD